MPLFDPVTIAVRPDWSGIWSALHVIAQVSQPGAAEAGAGGAIAAGPPASSAPHRTGR